MAPKTPRETLAALNKGSFDSNLKTLAYPSDLEPGTIILIPKT